MAQNGLRRRERVRTASMTSANEESHFRRRRMRMEDNGSQLGDNRRKIDKRSFYAAAPIYSSSSSDLEESTEEEEEVDLGTSRRRRNVLLSKRMSRETEKRRRDGCRRRHRHQRQKSRKAATVHELASPLPQQQSWSNRRTSSSPHVPVEELFPLLQRYFDDPKMSSVTMNPDPMSAGAASTSVSSWHSQQQQQQFNGDRIYGAFPCDDSSAAKQLSVDFPNSVGDDHNAAAAARDNSVCDTQKEFVMQDLLLDQVLKSNWDDDIFPPRNDDDVGDLLLQLEEEEYGGAANELGNFCPDSAVAAIDSSNSSSSRGFETTQQQPNLNEAENIGGTSSSLSTEAAVQSQYWGANDVRTCDQQQQQQQQLQLDHRVMEEHQGKGPSWQEPNCHARQLVKQRTVGVVEPRVVVRVAPICNSNPRASLLGESNNSITSASEEKFAKVENERSSRVYHPPPLLPSSETAENCIRGKLSLKGVAAENGRWTEELPRLKKQRTSRYRAPSTSSSEEPPYSSSSTEEEEDVSYLQQRRQQSSPVSSLTRKRRGELGAAVAMAAAGRDGKQDRVARSGNRRQLSKQHSRSVVVSRCSAVNVEKTNRSRKIIRGLEKEKKKCSSNILSSDRSICGSSGKLRVTVSSKGTFNAVAATLVAAGESKYGDDEDDDDDGTMGRKKKLSAAAEGSSQVTSHSSKHCRYALTQERQKDVGRVQQQQQRRASPLLVPIKRRLSSSRGRGEGEELAPRKNTSVSQRGTAATADEFANKSIKKLSSARDNSGDDFPNNYETKQKRFPLKTRIYHDSAEVTWLYCDLRGCSFYTKYEDRMKRHVLSHVKDQDGNLKCYLCPERNCVNAAGTRTKFKSLAKLLKHDRMMHTGIPDYECRVCEEEVTDINMHMKIHETKKEFSCDQCLSQFRHSNSLKRHMWIHTGKRPFTCNHCDVSFISPSRLKDHIRKCHEEEDKRTPDLMRAVAASVFDNPLEIQIVDEVNFNQNRKERSLRHQRKQQRKKKQQLQPTSNLPATIVSTIPVMSVVTGANGQMYLVDASAFQQTSLLFSPAANTPFWAQQQQQQPTLLLGSLPNTAAAAAAVAAWSSGSHSPPVMSPDNFAHPELQFGSLSPSSSLATPEPSDAPLLGLLMEEDEGRDFMDMAGTGRESSSWEDITDLCQQPQPSAKAGYGDLLTSAMVSSHLLTESEARRGSSSSCSSLEV